MSLNETITRELKERIGNLPDGARFATEAELCSEFGVSRMTINKIVTNLAGEGLLKRFPRRGTFVSRPRRTGLPEFSGTIFEMRRNKLKLHISEYYYPRTNLMWQTLLEKLRERLPYADIELTDDAERADLIWCTTRPDLELPVLESISCSQEDIDMIRQAAGGTEFFPCTLQQERAALPLSLSVNINLWNRKHFDRIFGSKESIPEKMVSFLLQSDWKRIDYPHVVSYLFCPLILMSLAGEGIVGYDPEDGAFDFSGDALHEHLHFHREMYRKLSPYLSDFNEADEIFRKFHNGEIMALNTFSAQLNYGCSMPECTVTARSLAGRIPAVASYIGIGRNAVSRALAVKAAGIIAGDELSLIAAGFQCNIPANTRSAYSEEFLKNMPSGIRELLDMLNQPLPLIDVAHFFTQGRVFSDMIGKYIIGDFTFEDIQKYIHKTGKGCL